MSEREFQAQILQLAHLLGWRTYHTFDSRRSTAGFPDLVMVRKQRVVYAELKVGRNRLTPAQADWVGALAGAGAEVYVWFERDWDEIQRVLGG